MLSTFQQGSARRDVKIAEFGRAAVAARATFLKQRLYFAGKEVCRPT
jgi:hypothetical protein